MSQKFLTSRLFLDVLFSAFLILFLSPFLILIGLLIFILSKESPLYWSERIGINNNKFSMPKFRTMTKNTPPLATHLITNPKSYLLPMGSFLRKTSIDELPQLFSVFKGDMSLVGPRPALFNEYELIEARTKLSIHTLKPGITGWAQINGRDDISMNRKIELDLVYLQKKSFLFDLKILFKTLSKVASQNHVSH